jgi:hypothetical protein
VGDAAAASARLQELLRGRPAAQVGGGGDPDAVLWMRPLPQSASLLVAYLSGRLSLWDLEHNRRLRDVSVASMGAILNGMRRKKQPPSAGRAGAATFADVSGGFAPKAAPAATTSTASAASAAAAAQRGDEAAHATSSGPRRRLHHATSHSGSHSHNAAEGSADEDGDSDGDERSQASSALQPQASLSTVASSAATVAATVAAATAAAADADADAAAAPDAARPPVSDAARRRREELAREKLAAKVSVAAAAVAASAAAQFATTLDDILRDTDRDADRAASAESRPRSKRSAGRERQAAAPGALQLVNGLDFSGLNAGVAERLSLVQRRAVAMQQMSQQLRRKDSALSAFRAPAAAIQLKRRTQHISLLRPAASAAAAAADADADESPTRRRRGRRAAQQRRGDEQHDTNAPQDDAVDDAADDGDDGDDGGRDDDDASRTDGADDGDARGRRPSSGAAPADADAAAAEPSPRRPEAPSLSQRPSALSDGRRSLVHTARRLVVRLDGGVVSATRAAPQPIVAQLSASVASGAALSAPSAASLPTAAAAASHAEATSQAKATAAATTTAAAPLSTAPPPGAASAAPAAPAAPICVDCLTLLPKTRVLIGACSDRYLRFWDADSYQVLCSCLYLDVDEAAAPPGHRPQKLQLPPEAFGGEALRLLQASDAEDVLVGGYDSGLLRVWSVQAYSLVTLRNLLQKHLQFQTLPSYLQQPQQPGDGAAPAAQEFGEGMALAIAPLSLLAEWRAHDCPILSRKCPALYPRRCVSLCLVLSLCLTACVAVCLAACRRALRSRVRLVQLRRRPRRPRRRRRHARQSPAPRDAARGARAAAAEAAARPAVGHGARGAGRLRALGGPRPARLPLEPAGPLRRRVRRLLVGHQPRGLVAGGAPGAASHRARRQTRGGRGPAPRAAAAGARHAPRRGRPRGRRRP